jgi:exodeoxyribonuclease-5/deoxyribonuclease V
MILAFDTYYYENKALTICIEFENWSDKNIHKVYHEILENVPEYISGEFYKRELPCILSLFRKINTDSIKAIIVDGFVFLDDAKKHGLGGHLYESLEKKIPIVGVAKTNFGADFKQKVEVFRGKSKNPLYVTAIGTDKNAAKQHILEMYGEFRIPKLLKELDQLTRNKDFMS